MNQPHGERSGGEWRGRIGVAALLALLGALPAAAQQTGTLTGVARDPQGRCCLA